MARRCGWVNNNANCCSRELARRDLYEGGQSVYRVLPAVPLVLVVVFVLVASSQASGLEGSKFREAVRSDTGVVASESPDASRIGLEVLDGGGNAVDAAVAANLPLGVGPPPSRGVGGGGGFCFSG